MIVKISTIPLNKKSVKTKNYRIYLTLVKRNGKILELIIELLQIS